MNKLMELGDEYAKSARWTDFALVKLCLCAVGIMIGCSIPEKKRRPVVAGAFVVFFATYLPLVLKVIGLLFEEDEE